MARQVPLLERLRLSLDLMYTFRSPQGASEARKQFRALAGERQALSLPDFKGALHSESDFMAKRLFATVDSDGDGLVSEDEFVAVMTTLQAGSLDERLAFAYRLYDARGAGAITAPEALRILREACRESGLQVSAPALEELNQRLFEAAAAVTAAGCAVANSTASCPAEQLDRSSPLHDGCIQLAAPIADMADSSSLEHAALGAPTISSSVEQANQRAVAQAQARREHELPTCVQLPLPTPPPPPPPPNVDPGPDSPFVVSSAGAGSGVACAAALGFDCGEPVPCGHEQPTLTFHAFRALVLKHPELVGGLTLPSPGHGEEKARWLATCAVWAYNNPQRLLSALILVAMVLGAFATEFVKYTRESKRLALMGWSLPIAKGCGEALKATWALILLPLCRRTVTALRATWLRRILPFDDAIPHHKALAIAGFGFAWAHSLAHGSNIARAVDPARRAQYAAAFPPGGGGWMPTEPSVKAFLGSYVVITGTLMLLILCVMFAFALEWPRQARRVRDSALGRVLNNFNNFWLTHHLFIAFYVLLIFHPRPGLPPRAFDWGAGDTWLWVAAPLALYTGERAVRAWHSHTWRVPVVHAQQLTADVVTLTLAKPRGFRHAAGQYAFLQCRAISSYEWHPFTISSAPGAGRLTFHMRAAGDWTRALATRVAQAAAARSGVNQQDAPWVSDGPDLDLEAGPAPEVPDSAFATGGCDPGAPQQPDPSLARPSAMLRPLPTGCAACGSATVAGIESARHLGDRVRAAAASAPAPLVTSQQASPARWWKRDSVAPAAPPTPSLLTLAVDGPYGAPAQMAGDYRVLLLIGAGIGVTPYAAILHGLVRQFRAADKGDGVSVRKAYFLWAARDQNAAAWFAAALQSISALDTERRIEIDIYYTRARAPTDVRMTLFRVAQVAAHQQVGIDVVSGVESHVITHFGRPNFDAIMQRVADAHAGETVGTFYCGPPLLAKALEAGCRRASQAAARGGGGARFVFHQERF